MEVLQRVYGETLLVRPPAPVNVNKAGANYKSEVTHLSYSPRRAFDEWTSICEAILALGGDAVFEFDAADDPFLGQPALAVAADGTITPDGSNERLGHLDDVFTGRVFTANGPWVVREGDSMRAIMQHMLPHRRGEEGYYTALLERVAEASGCSLEVVPNPHRWEGMADVAVVGDRVVFTYAVPGHYDEGIAKKSERSCRAGVEFVADTLGIPSAACIYAELVYPHFHGDTVHFGARPTQGPAKLVHYAGGLWRDGSKLVVGELGNDAIVAIGQDDAVEQYAGNSRQVKDGVLVPDTVSVDFTNSLESMGLSIQRVPLFELFGKAGGGPGCATLYLPTNLGLPVDAPFRFSQRRSDVAKRREALPEKVTVSRDYFAGRARG